MKPDDRVLRLQPRLGVLERRRHLLPRHRPRAARARPPRHLLRARRLRAPAHRDIADPDWARVVVYRGSDRDAPCARARRRRGSADVVVKASGVGVFDELLERGGARLRGAGALCAVLGRRRAGDARPPAAQIRDDPLRALVPRYDLVLTYGGGEPVVRRLHARSARARCVPIYNALDPRHAPPGRAATRASAATWRSSATGCPIARRASRSSSFAPPSALPRAPVPARRQRLGGQGAAAERRAASATSTRAITTPSTARRCAVLNVNRESMARYGFSPATRVFEAAGAGACLITDAWEGIEQFLEPGREVLVARDGEEVAAHLARARRPARARAHRRAPRGAASCAEHTYAHRAAAAGARCSTRRASRRARMTARLRFVFLGLSITSSWGNGHATTYRALLRALGAARPRRAVPRARRALVRGEPRPARAAVRPHRALRHRSTSCATRFGRDGARRRRWSIVGSYVPEGARSATGCCATARGASAPSTTSTRR